MLGFRVHNTQSEVAKFVLSRAIELSGDRRATYDCHVSQLFRDPWDFIELCEEIEERYRLDLRPYFEDGQPERGWGPWRRKVARDLTLAELIEQVVSVVSGRT